MTQLILAPLCLLYTLPGPPSVNIQNGTYQVYPINRLLCPDIDSHRDSVIELYTGKNPEVPQYLFPNNDSSIQNSYLNFSRDTVIFFHGFLESSRSDNAVRIRKAYLDTGDYNVLIIDNQRLLAGPDYVTAAGNCLAIGKYIAKFLDYLVTYGLDFDKLHVIGMSLGGQIAGFVGKNVKSGTIGRITGLDPAGPLFSLLSADKRIGPDDAKHVTVIHTNAGFSGIDKSSGRVDIGVNGGVKQPGCSLSTLLKRKPFSLSELVFCNHYYSYRLWESAIRNPSEYVITKCPNDNFKSRTCESSTKTVIGEKMDLKLSGTFIINVNKIFT